MTIFTLFTLFPKTVCSWGDAAAVTGVLPSHPNNFSRSNLVTGGIETPFEHLRVGSTDGMISTQLLKLSDFISRAHFQLGGGL